jgi:hypothetical protein
MEGDREFCGIENPAAVTVSTRDFHMSGECIADQGNNTTNTYRDKSYASRNSISLFKEEVASKLAFWSSEGEVLFLTMACTANNARRLSRWPRAQFLSTTRRQPSMDSSDVFHAYAADVYQTK